KCPECGGLKPPHKVCIHCGYYKGNSVVQVTEA
ncbi:MAG: 50S ribosomal protein L32, partial [Spirochaetales bacterium]|nr:50S ribosomal protein L32 [Spirochaetales bacterium]